MLTEKYSLVPDGEKPQCFALCAFIAQSIVCDSIFDELVSKDSHLAVHAGLPYAVFKMCVTVQVPVGVIALHLKHVSSVT